MGKAMTIDSSLSRIRYVGNGVTTNFSIPFAYLTNNDGTAQLAVYIGDSDTPLIEKDDYTIEGIKGSQVGEAAFEDKFDSGTVIFKTAPESGVAIAVIRNVPQTQSIVFIEGSKFPAQDFENGLDKLTMEVQEVKENLQRAIVLPPTSTENPLEARDDVLRARDEAVQSSNDALRAISEANKTLDEVVKYTDQAVADINTTVETATANIENSISQAVEDVKEEAVNVATNVVADVVGQYTDRAETAAKNAEADASRTAESANQASASATSAATSASEAEAIAGEVSVYNFKNKITNCITEIPQDIKLELNNGTLTLKAGSKVYVPNGAGKFDVVTVNYDKPCQNGWGSQGEKQFLFFDYALSLRAFPVNYCFSGNTAPTSFRDNKHAIWYDTANNSVKITADGGVTWTGGSSLSLGIVVESTSENVIDTIDQVFNGFGYIGSTVYALPGVKGLIPNGRNEDGSLKNIEFTLDSVKTVNVVANQTNYSFVLNSDGIYSLSTYQEVNVPVSGYVNYVASENKIYNGVNQRFWAYVASYSSGANGVITSFTPKLPFRAVDQNDFNRLDEEVVKLDEEAAKLGGDNLYTGRNEFQGIFKLLYHKGNEGAQIDWKTGNQSVIRDTVVKQDVVDHRMRFYASNSAGTVVFPLTLNFETGLASTTTPPATDNSTNVATTAWVHNNKATIVGWGIPDYSSVVEISSGFTAPQAGVVHIVKRGAGGADASLIVYINGQALGMKQYSYHHGITYYTASVDVGDVVTWEMTGGGSSSCNYFPFKGVK